MLTASALSPSIRPDAGRPEATLGFLLTAANVVSASAWVGGPGMCSGRQRWCTSAGRTCSATWPPAPGLHADHGSRGASGGTRSQG